ncbi:MAG: cellulase family glycosylhydrolase [Bacteroidota bacterium]|nr:cellulase family glycosylhydrolase [Bacteroidota bacterium]
MLVSKWIFLFIFINPPLLSQDSSFITRSGTSLILNDLPFYAIGVNCYFLQNLAAYGDTAHLNEVFQEAKQLGVTTIRTWGFFDSPDNSNAAVIQHSPGNYSEEGLKALDYVIAKAKEYSIRLIIPLVNNWEDYGGMNQYVRWYAERGPYLNQTLKKIEQQIITGVDGRFYRVVVSDTFTHDEFYTNSTIKQWYKDYILMLLHRKNTITDILYKDDPVILVWELANEPRSSDRTGMVVTNWLDEISTFIKSIDRNHLVSSGEEGLEVSRSGYYDPHLYDDQSWLFDGSAGVSFLRNIQLQNIDIGSIHCYPDHWRMTGIEGIQWLRNHNRIAAEFQKPLVLGEVGKWKKPAQYYEAAFNEALYSTTAGVLLWQFVYDSRPNNDGYAFSYPNDSVICNIIQFYAERFAQKRNNLLPTPPNIELLPNYPNPFNIVTIIPYTLHRSSYMTMDIYNTAGQHVVNLFDGVQTPGYHAILFDGFGLGSGTYFVRWVADNNVIGRKMTFLK